jgi:hypothetical protein
MVGQIVIVDAANVVGSVPDGWWRDRVGAAERPRDRLAAAGAERIGGELVLVVEGKARGVRGVPGVRVVAAPGSGDDAIVDLLVAEREHFSGVSHTVITADRQLKQRVTALGAATMGPATFLRQLAGIQSGES